MRLAIVWGMSGINCGVLSLIIHLFIGAVAQKWLETTALFGQKQFLYISTLINHEYLIRGLGVYVGRGRFGDLMHLSWGRGKVLDFLDA